jgi:hypothetical protein
MELKEVATLGIIILCLACSVASQQSLVHVLVKACCDLVNCLP